MREMSVDGFQRYSRQIAIPEIGVEGQARLRSSRALIVGAGGLGSPAAYYLSAAGVGHIGVADDDRVQVSNLGRQILYVTDDVGRPKAEVAAKRLKQLNPEIEITPYQVRVDSAIATELADRYSVVLDCTDNFDTRYAVNDACVRTGKPYVFGSVYRFEGQVSVFGMPGGPCYRCVYPVAPPGGLFSDCSDGGVLGAIPGMIGSVMAAEAIKLILGIKASLSDTMLVVDMLHMRIVSFATTRNPDCPVCSGLDNEDRTPTTTGKAEQPVSQDGMDHGRIDPQELRERQSVGEKICLIDVRAQEEFVRMNMGGTSIPLDELYARVTELDPGLSIVVCCTGEARSREAARFLRARGFRHVRWLSGGIEAWMQTIGTSFTDF